jgi:hypothetical protein
MVASSTRFKGSIRWWWGFGLLIATPALLLAIIGLRIARAERIQEEQRRHEQQTQLARMADAGLATLMAEIESELRRIDHDTLNLSLKDPFSTWHVVFYRRNGLVVFYRDKIYFDGAETDVHLKPVPAEWPSDIEDLIERAQTTEVQATKSAAILAYDRVAKAEPKLSDWAKLSVARVAQHAADTYASKELSDPIWSDAGVLLQLDCQSQSLPLLTQNRYRVNSEVTSFR